MADAGGRPQDSAQAKADAIALAEAEAAEAEALAAAARARARAIKLRREAEVQARAADDQAADQDNAQEAAEVAETADITAETAEATEAAEPSEAAETPKPAESTRRRLPVQGFSRVLTVATIVSICALLGASGWMLWRHHTAVAERQQSAAFVAAARQGVINLTSLDFNHAKEDVQRVLDSGTGEFRDQFQRVADDFASVVKDSKAVTQGSVKAAAVESLSKDSAVVLLLGNERITNSTGAKNDPRAFRFRVTVTRDGDQLKISKVEYVL